MNKEIKAHFSNVSLNCPAITIWNGDERTFGCIFQIGELMNRMQS